MPDPNAPNPDVADRKVVVTVSYPFKAGSRFDLDYYMNRHMPMVSELWGPEGLAEAHVLQGTGTPAGEPAPVGVTALLHFASLRAFKSAGKKHGAAVMGDIKNFTDIEPVIQFNAVLS